MSESRFDLETGALPVQPVGHLTKQAATVVSDKSRPITRTEHVPSQPPVADECPSPSPCALRNPRITSRGVAQSIGLKPVTAARGGSSDQSSS